MGQHTSSGPHSKRKLEERSPPRTASPAASLRCETCCRRAWGPGEGPRQRGPAGVAGGAAPGAGSRPGPARFPAQRTKGLSDQPTLEAKAGRRKTSEKYRKSPLAPKSPVTAEAGTGLARPRPMTRGAQTCIRSVTGAPNERAPPLHTATNSWLHPQERHKPAQSTPGALGSLRPSGLGRRHKV